MIEKQQWIILPAELVKKLPGLRLSPLGLVPQRGRRDRMICDYSYFGVNSETFELAPKEAMQFGRTLLRLLHRIYYADPSFGPVYISKINLSDGFYRLWISPSDTTRLAVIFPTRSGEPQLIGIPLTHPMGWISLPPNFCACTETITDLANAELISQPGLQRARSEPHRLDEISETVPSETEAIFAKPAETKSFKNKTTIVPVFKAEPKFNRTIGKEKVGTSGEPAPPSSTTKSPIVTVFNAKPTNDTDYLEEKAPI